MSQSHHLLIVSPGNEPIHCPLTEDLVSLGKEADNQICIEFEGVSSKQCNLVRTEAGYVVSDHGSTTGTFLNGEAIQNSAVRMTDGDVLTFGNSVYAYYTVAHDGAAPSEITDISSGQTVRNETENQVGPFYNRDCDDCGMITLSFVIPLQDEQDSIQDLYEKIRVEASRIAIDWEIIFVDDGSKDKSWEVIRLLAELDPAHVSAYRFLGKQGKSTALAAGYKQATGDFVFTLDANLEDDPREIPRFLLKMADGYDIVTGWKRERSEPWYRFFSKKIGNRVVSQVNGVSLHDHTSGYKCFRREVVKNLPMYGEMHSMIPSLASIHGYRITEIPVIHHRTGKPNKHRPRALGGFMDMWSVFFIKNYRQRPLHFIGGIALCFGLAAITSLVACLVLQVSLTLTAIVFALLGSVSVLLFISGLHTSLMVHHYEQHHDSIPVAEKIERNTEPSAEILSMPDPVQAPAGATNREVAG